MTALPKKRILVTGASGFVGYNLAAFLAKRYQVFASYHSHMVSISGCTTLHLDITDLAELASLVKAISPAFIINAAAISSPDACAQNPRLAQSVNVDGIKNMLAVARLQGCRLLHLLLCPRNGELDLCFLERLPRAGLGRIQLRLRLHAEKASLLSRQPIRIHRFTSRKTASRPRLATTKAMAFTTAK